MVSVVGLEDPDVGRDQNVCLQALVDDEHLVERKVGKVTWDVHRRGRPRKGVASWVTTEGSMASRWPDGRVVDRGRAPLETRLRTAHVPP
jgi:hypothetical protein